MKPPVLHSYLLWRSSVPPDEKTLASCRLSCAVTLLPAAMVGLFVFGWYAGVVVFVSLASAFVTDMLLHRYNPFGAFANPYGTQDWTWLISGLLIALMLPPNIAWYVPLVASVAAIVLGKHLLQADGMTWLQPAAVGLLVAHLLFFWMLHPSNHHWPVLARPIQQAAEEKGKSLHYVREFLGGDVRLAIDRKKYFDDLFHSGQPQFDANTRAEAYFQARPLDVIKDNPGKDISTITGSDQVRYSTLDLFLGYTPGAIGAASAFALLWGIFYIILTARISWLMPTLAMATLWACLLVSGSPNPGIHLFSGYTLLGFFYFGADPGTLARTKRGKMMAGMFLGLLEFCFRSFTGLAEATFASAIIVQGMSYVLDMKLAKPKDDKPSSILL